MNTGWRTLIVERPSGMYVRDNNLITAAGKKIPLSELGCIVITDEKGNISMPLINRMAQFGVNVVVCDEKKIPCGQIVGLNQHSMVSGNLFEQVGWKQSEKDRLWKEIVINKISMQKAVLQKLGIAVPPIINGYIHDVTDGDRGNCEGAAARVYFRALYGSGFVRHAIDDTNSALNYGYTVLMSFVTRAVTSHGYNTALGINHCSMRNPFNLSCDIMEPFRPLVDEIVFKNLGRELDSDYKKDLIKSFGGSVLYNRQNFDIPYAIDRYTIDIIKSMSDGRKIGGIEIEQ